MAQRFCRLYIISDSLFLYTCQAVTGDFVCKHTKILSSGKPPSIFLSHMSSGGCDPLESQTRKRPAVSSVFRGTRATDSMIGGGNVRKSSVWTHVALCNLVTQNVKKYGICETQGIDYQRHCKAGSDEIAITKRVLTHAVAELYCYSCM